MSRCCLLFAKCILLMFGERRRTETTMDDEDRDDDRPIRASDPLERDLRVFSRPPPPRRTHRRTNARPLSAAKPLAFQRPDPWPDEPDAARGEKTCSLCETRGLTAVTVPCGHQMCVGCSLRLLDRRCPFCRTEMACVTRVYPPK